MAGARSAAPAPAESSARRDQGPGAAGGWLTEALPLAATTGAAVALVDAAADLTVALTPPPPPPAPPAPGEIAVFAAMSVLGTPYRYGGTGPGGFDCSGLTGWAWAKAGVRLPRVSGAQMSAGTRVSVFDLRPGDLVFYGSGHVGMYAGDGRVVHSPRTGKSVEVVPLERGGMRPTAFVRPA
ncbi:MAG: C40 family peptidase [Microthrixaceae bacterium]